MFNGAPRAKPVNDEREKKEVLAGDLDLGRLGVLGFELGVFGFAVLGAFPLLVAGVLGTLGVFGVLGFAVGVRGLNLRIKIC